MHGITSELLDLALRVGAEVDCRQWKSHEK